MDADQLQAINARDAARTPGKWYAIVDDLIGGWDVALGDARPASERDPRNPEERTVACLMHEPDAVFIAHASEDIPALVAEVERLTAELNPADEQIGELLNG